MRRHNQRIHDVDDSYLKQQQIHISWEVYTLSEGKNKIFLLHMSFTNGTEHYVDWREPFIPKDALFVQQKSPVSSAIFVLTY